MQKNRRVNRVTKLLAGCAGIALCGSITTGMAQTTTIIGGSGSSGVYINEQMIGAVPNYSNAYSYTPQIAPSFPGTSNNQIFSRPGNLLFPPKDYPHSQISITNFADFKGSGYNPTSNSFQDYAPQTYNSWQQPGQLQSGLTSGGNLYNPYGQPLVPASQVSKNYKSSLIGQPQYPTKVPAFNPQSQLLVPPPQGSSRVVQLSPPAETLTPVIQKSVSDNFAKVSPPAAPKVVIKEPEPIKVALAPTSIIPPAPAATTTKPIKIEPVATAESIAASAPVPTPQVKPKAEVITQSSANNVQANSTPEPAPAIELVTAEPVLTPPPVPGAVIPDSNSGIPTAPVIAAAALTESTVALSPPPAPVETAPVVTASVKTSAITPGGELKPVSLFFEPDRAELTSDTKSQLNELADYLLANETKVIQLLAYAGDNENNAQARRVSLSRALAVRGVLMERGVQSTRMHVRALGNKSKSGNPDRVEIIPVLN